MVGVSPNNIYSGSDGTRVLDKVGCSQGDPEGTHGKWTDFPLFPSWFSKELQNSQRNSRAGVIESWEQRGRGIYRE